MSVKNEINQKPLRTVDFLDCKIFYAGNRKICLIETPPIGVVLLINILTEKPNFAVKEIFGVEFQRREEKSLPTWISRIINIQASMQKSEKKFTFESFSNKLGFDQDFDRIKELHTFGNKGV